VNRAVHTATPGQGGVRGIDDRVDIERRDVSLNYLDHGRYPTLA
jgi:hypothetical protein